MALRSFSVAQPKLQTALLKWEVEPEYTRKVGTLLAGTSIIVGAVLAAITGTWDAASAAKSGGNTGTGTLTFATPKTGTGRQAGVYSIRAKADTFSVGAPSFVGTGNGVLTRANPAFGVGVVAGTYKAVCIEPATDSGTFEVFDPAGVSLGRAVVGTAFTGVVKFTIADGSTDFAAGDEFSLAVTGVITGNGGVFSVVGPNGVALADASVGVAYTSQIKFTIADGGTDFIVGDGFDVTVVNTAGSDDGKLVVLDTTKDDGSQTAIGLAIDNMTAPDDADLTIEYLGRGPAIVLDAGYAWPDGISDGDKAAVIASLDLKGILTATD